MDKRKITDLVEENYVAASVLFYFGVEFYHHSEKTINEVCQTHGLNKELVIEKLESSRKDQNTEDIDLMQLPVKLVTEYLKHKHYLFIKQTLPYLAKLINHYPAHSSDLMKDLKFVFPLFVEDYIHHMYEEEDHVFQYILRLDKAISGKLPMNQIYFEMEKNSIGKFASEHLESDDDMRQIRKLTNNYLVMDESPVLQKVIYSELQSFEKALITHSRVENEVLLPKALMLEKELKSKIVEIRGWN